MTEQPTVKTLNPDMDHTSRETECGYCVCRIHTAMVNAFTAMNKEEGANALSDLQSIQGHCLELIHRIAGMQISNESLEVSQ